MTETISALSTVLLAAPSAISIIKGGIYAVFIKKHKTRFVINIKKILIKLFILQDLVESIFNFNF